MINQTIKDLFLEDILPSYRVHYLILSPSSPNLSDLDFQLRAQMIQNFDYKKLFLSMTKGITPENPVEYTDDLGLHYMIFLDESSNDEAYFFLGPFIYEAYSDSELFQLMQIKKIPMSLRSDVSTFFQRVTVIKDMLSWQFMAIRIISKLNNHNSSFRIVDARIKSDERKENDETTFTPKSTVAFASLEARYKVEAGLIHAVTEGNIQDALYYYNMFMGFTLESRFDDELRNGKDMLISVNTFLRKAVQEAYVHPLYIDDLNQKLTHNIEACTSVIQLNNLCATMIRKYCLLVKSYSRAQYSTLIRDCLNYIDFHYQENLSLEILAKKYIVSKSYLSSLFHKEAGMTLTDYINTTRIRHSILLLNTTSLSMQDIAEQCGFSDGNYFTRTFKKFQGISPLKYRQQLLNND